MPIPTFRAQNWHFCALLPASFSRWWFLGAPSRALSAESPAERQLCCSYTRKSIGPSAPIAYATSLSPPNETAACRGAQVPRSIIGRKLLARVPRSIFGKSLLAETDQNTHKEFAHKEAGHKETAHKKVGHKKNVHKENCARRRVCSRRESNPYGHFCPQDFKSCVSTYSTTRAVQI